MRRCFLFFFLFLFSTCTSMKPTIVFKIGIDPDWMAIRFEFLQSNVYGFVEELLLTIAKKQKIGFIFVKNDLPILIQNMDKGELDGVISAMYPYNFNEAKYDFSHSLLDIGPVIVTRKAATYGSLKDLTDRSVGILKDQEYILEGKSFVVQKIYENPSNMLEQLRIGFLDAVLLDNILAQAYLARMTDLETVGKSINREKIKIITKEKELAKHIDLALIKFKIEGKLYSLKRKYKLYNQ